MASKKESPGRVAVVGSGISGLSSACLLQRAGWSVTLYESEATFGGHTLTDETIPGVPVDLGFQVFNRSTYGHFEQFLEMLGVDSEESDMSFALSVDNGRLEWGSQKGLLSIFQQKKNLVSPEFWTMLKDVYRFGKEAPKVLDNDKYRDMTLEAYLKEHNYSRSFTYNYCLPMCAAIWSVSNKQCFEFSIQVLVRFWVNHHLLDLIERPQWRVVKNRSRSYVAAVIAELTDARAGCPVVSCRKVGDSYEIKDAKGGSDKFDHIVMATHTNVTLAILGDEVSAGQREVLEGVPYSNNDIYLHRDPALMPKDPRVWASWNCLDQTDLNKEAPSSRPVCVSYYVNMLQRLPEGSGDLFVTLNPPTPPAKDTIVRQLKMSHPIFSFASRDAQEKLPSVNGENNIWLCGAWCGYGFHEDGIKAAVDVVKGLGGTIPWVPRPTSPYMTMSTRFVNASVHKMAGSAIKKGSLRLIMPNGTEVVYGNQSDCAPAGHIGGTRGALSAPCHTRVRVFDCNFFLRLAKDTDIGMGESYMHGEFEPDDLTNMLNVMVQNVESCNDSQGKLGIINWVGTQMQTLAHMARSNTVEGSRKNISEHYDLGNDMYKLFLDETWMYSSGVFNSPDDSLYQSQINKLDLILDKMDLTPDHHIFEIGCGWGGFACRAAERFGCRVTGITISEEQLKYAQAKVKERGFDSLITILFCDYRKIPAELDATFDRVVSIEMIEAVGHENLPEYFGIIDRMLKPGGRAVLQAITYKDEYYANYCKCSDFIRRHIFPGGHLPSMGAMLRATSTTSLAVTHVEDIGLHYATTLKLWHQNWVAAENDIYKLGYSKEFFRKWRFYFSYCEAGFEQQFIHNYQIVWCKSPVSLTACSVAGSMADPDATRVLGLELDSHSTGMVWCFCVGVAAGKYLAMLWPVPLAAAFFFGLSLISRQVAPRVAPALMGALDADSSAALHTSLVSASFSFMAVVLLLVAAITGGFSDLSAQTEVSSTTHMTLSLWCGFSMWALWDGVRSKSTLRTPAQSGFAVNTLALCAGVMCLSRQLLVAYLCLPLVSEVHSLLMHIRTISGLAKKPSPLLEQAHWGALAVFRVAAHLAISIKVISDRTLFPHAIFFGIALVSMILVNCINLRLLLDLAIVQPTASKLAQDDYLNASPAEGSATKTLKPKAE